MSDKRISELATLGEFIEGYLVPLTLDTGAGETKNVNTTLIIEKINELISEGIVADAAITTFSDDLDVIESGYAILDCSAGDRTFYLSPSAIKVKIKRIDETTNDCIITSDGATMTFDGLTTFEVMPFRAQELRKEGTGVTIW